MSEADLLCVESLNVSYRTGRGKVRALNDVDLVVEKGRTLGIVGESGSGKSTLPLAIMGLLPAAGAIDSGRVTYKGREIQSLSNGEIRKLRAMDMAMIFQDPMTSLNPFMSIEAQIVEQIRCHRDLSRGEASRMTAELLEQVGIADAATRMRSYPHEFSGGMRQRAMIAMALSCDPDLIFADEPTTALDVTIQAQILENMRTIQRKRGMSMVLITHDLGVVAKCCDDVAVMYAGRIVEKGPVDEVLYRPIHPYTRGLLACMPTLKRPRDEALSPIAGQPPVQYQLPKGCGFAERCPEVDDACREATIPMEKYEHGHSCRCIHAMEMSGGSE